MLSWRPDLPELPKRWKWVEKKDGWNAQFQVPTWHVEIKRRPKWWPFYLTQYDYEVPQTEDWVDKFRDWIAAWTKVAERDG